MKCTRDDQVLRLHAASDEAMLYLYVFACWSAIAEKNCQRERPKIANFRPYSINVSNSTTRRLY